jgi:hypothetical protein
LSCPARGQAMTRAPLDRPQSKAHIFFLFGMYSRGHKFWQENPFARSVYQAIVPVKDGRAS